MRGMAFFGTKEEKKKKWWGVKDATRSKWSSFIFGHFEAFIFERWLWLPYVLPCYCVFLHSSFWSLLIRRSGLLSLEKNEGEDDEDDDGVETTALCLPLSISSAISSRAIKCCSLITFFSCLCILYLSKKTQHSEKRERRSILRRNVGTQYIPLHAYYLLFSQLLVERSVVVGVTNGNDRDNCHCCTAG